jgi:hypothetical protein
MEYVVPNVTDRGPVESILTETMADIGKLTSEIVSPDFEFDTDSGSVEQ